MSTATTPDVEEPDPAPSVTAPRGPSRWWIAAVPVAIVVMLAANGYRVPVFWYQSGLHHEIASADSGTWARVTEKYADGQGDTTRRYSVRFAGLGGADPAYEDRSGDDITLPDGMVARTVTLDFEAEPDQVLKNCAVTLIDDRGREYRVGGASDAIGPGTTACVPEDTPGPSLPVLRNEPRGAIPEDEEPRPRTWSTATRIPVPEDATFVELRISFENPDYVTLRLPR
ncbi:MULTISPECIES: hypothetical protein [unclassified Knoellia]|uniref:hypothetical protein n=1 Tax=Knoellia altitudinis TaxID=3404795 RepID=UPI003615232F